MLKSITDLIKDTVIPPVCAACGRISAYYLCQNCISSIVPISSGAMCSCCGSPLPEEMTGMCGLCRSEGYGFTAHRSFALYSGNMKEVIRKYKYKKVFGLGLVLAGFLSEVYEKHFAGKDIDYVDTVPGEHTELLAASFSNSHRIPFAANIIRIRDPERQGGMGLAERKVNILDCFKLRDCLAYKGKNVLVIDDVWTTGSTLREICRAVSSGGARGIYLLTLARRI